MDIGQLPPGSIAMAAGPSDIFNPNRHPSFTQPELCHLGQLLSLSFTSSPRRFGHESTTSIYHEVTQRLILVM
ncbi:hypothetical protein LTR37_001424 [Vermiconidia calcicola]|uniref:Uncharacterized protein n=1 Tax=Vermiconidia calcicola TaxID=1690605 RepID=A0ACC3NVY0_9PEZI|nr:hypothetical protein LTR37_001424 [Vermiconidia calcicola]